MPWSVIAAGKRLSAVFLCTLVLTACVPEKRGPEITQEEFRAAVPAASASTPADHIASTLAETLARLKAAGYPRGAAATALSTPLVRVDNQGRLAVVITLQGPMQASQSLALLHLGVAPVTHFQDTTSLQAWLPAGQAEAVAALPFVRWLAPAMTGHTR
jgi:hypothetical protein